MKKVSINGRVYQVPQQWGECSKEQLDLLLPLQLVPTGTSEQTGRMKRAVLHALFPKLDTYEKDLTGEQWYALGKLTEWVWTAKVTTKPFPAFTLRTATLKAGAYREETFLLPDEGFVNTSAIEMAMANIHYLAFTKPKKPDVKAVYKLLATLCRPVRKDLKKFRVSSTWNGDTREEYNTTVADERAVLFESLPIGTVMAITQYFEALNDTFLTVYKEVYEADPAAEEEPPMYQNGEGLVTTLMDVAREGLFGDFDKVCSQNCHTVWLYLRDNNKKIKRANARAEAQNQ